MEIEISLCMIVKNEEANLAACLESVQGVADEMVVVDTGSADQTIEIASRYTDKIYHFDWIDDFAAARNFSFAKASKDYIMWLDADDCITEEVRQNLMRTKRFFPADVDFVVMDYHTRIDADSRPVTITRRERIVRRAAGFRWSGAVHENLGVSGKGYYSHMYITHNRQNFSDSFQRNFGMIRKRVESGAADAKDFYYYAGMLYDKGDSEQALTYFQKYFDLRKTGLFLDGQKIFFVVYQLWMQKGAYKEALKVLTDHEDELRGKSEYYCHLGFFYRDARGDHEKACEYFRQALQCHESAAMMNVRLESSHEYYYFIPYAALGQCLITLRRYRDAYDAFRMALFYKHDEEIQTLSEKLERALSMVPSA